MNFVLSYWIFDQTDPEELESYRGISWQEDDIWAKFIFWLNLESYIFMATIASGIVFMFIRALFKIQIQIHEEINTATEKTDHLEANRIILEINDATITPLIASILLV